MLPVIIALVAFAVLLFLLSFKFDGTDVKKELENMNLQHAAEMFKLKKRVKALEEEMENEE